MESVLVFLFVVVGRGVPLFARGLSRERIRLVEDRRRLGLCRFRRAGRLFRRRETEIAASYGARSGLVVACGGGVVTRPENYDLLHQNGTICFVDRPLYQLSSEGRPVSQLKGIERLANERMDLYRGWSDVEISCTGTAQGDALLLKARLGL